MDSEFERYGVYNRAYVPGYKRYKHPGRYRTDLPQGTWGQRTLEVTDIIKNQVRSTYTVQRGPSTYFYKIPRKDAITIREAQMLPRGGSIMRVVATANEEPPEGYIPGEDAPETRTIDWNRDNFENIRKRMGFLPPNSMPDMNNDGNPTLRRAPVGTVLPGPPIVQAPISVPPPPTPPPPPPPPPSKSSEPAKRKERPELSKTSAASYDIVAPNGKEDMMAQIAKGVPLKKAKPKSPTVQTKIDTTNPASVLMHSLKGRRIAMKDSPVSPRDEW